MKKIYLKSIVFGLATVALASCSDVADEITSIVYNRNFSPTSVEAKVRNRTNIELSWNLGDGVTNYNVEVYANDSLTFAGSPVQSFSVTPDQVPVLITGLDGETQYSFRVQATDGDATRDSKWSGVYAKTEAEQLFKNVKEEDIKAKEVTLRWTAGEEAATVTLTPGNIVYNITAADIAAGAATVTGLTPETEYTAVMARANGKTRGKISFTTGVYLEETDILVKAGSNIAQAITDAPEGYRLIVEPGTYGIATDEAAFGGSVTVSKNLTIKGLRQNDHPVIQGRFKVEASLTIDQVTLDGKGTDGGQAFDFTAANTIDHFTVNNSEVTNYTKGFYYVNKAAKINSLVINNCLISNIECDGGDMFDCRAGAILKLNITNNTIWNSCKGRDLVRYDDKSSNFEGVAPVITLDHNTIVGACNDAGKRILYVRFKGNSINFTNNIVASSAGNFSNQKNTAEPTFSNNIYFEADGFVTSGANANALFVDSEGTILDPQFADAANGNFTIGNDNVKDKKAGDPRWY
jgi:hypothetical protein